MQINNTTNINKHNSREENFAIRIVYCGTWTSVWDDVCDEDEQDKEEEKKNGAHKHRSLFSTFCVSNIHVMLSYAKITKSRQQH